MPNSEVFTSAVRVRTAYSKRRTDLAVGVDYNTSLPDAKEILLSTIKTSAGVLNKPDPEIDIVGFGDSSIDFIVRYWTKPRQPDVRTAQTEAIIAIKQALDAANIGIPYPIRTVYHFDQERYSDNISNQPDSDRVNDNSNSKYTSVM